MGRLRGYHDLRAMRDMSTRAVSLEMRLAGHGPLATGLMTSRDTRRSLWARRLLTLQAHDVNEGCGRGGSFTTDARSAEARGAERPAGWVAGRPLGRGETRQEEPRKKEKG